MPIKRLKSVWGYCSYNIPFFILIFILILIISFISDFILKSYGKNFTTGWIIQFIFSSIVTGYGMLITRDKINHGYRLPKIKFRDVIYLGFLGNIVYIIYFSFQLIILGYIATFFQFPVFDLHKIFFDFYDTFLLLIYSNPKDSFLFFSLSILIFYLTTFFAELGLAVLADTKSITSAFNLVSIYKDINIVGWKNYAIHISVIALLILIFSALQTITIPIPLISDLWGAFFGLLVFITQYWGIGAVYCNIKDKLKQRSINSQ